MEYRRANRGDIERFVENRVEFAASIRQIDELELFRKRTRDYVEEHMEKDDMVIFIAVEGDKIISSCMACIFHTAECLYGAGVPKVRACRKTGTDAD